MHRVVLLVLLPLLAATAVLVLGLSIMLSVKKASRNRRERHSGERRQAWRDAIAEGEVLTMVHMARASARRFGPREDLAFVLMQTPLTERTAASLRAAAQLGGLETALFAALDSRDAAMRGMAMTLLATLGCTDAVPQLATAMGDVDPEVRQVAVRALARLATPDAAWVLIRALRDSVVPRDRIIEQLVAPFATSALLEAVVIDELREVRGDIAEAIGLARAVRGLPSLTWLVRYGNERERVRACRAIGRIGVARAAPVLIDALDDESWTVTAQAAKALGQMGDESAVPHLEALLVDRNWWVRANSAEALGRCGAAGFAALERATYHEDRFARDRAREALALTAAAAEHEYRTTHAA